MSTSPARTALITADGALVGAGADQTATPESLPGLDAIRACAALGVVVFHVASVLVFRGFDVFWARAGDAGVSVFFVLSGFLISQSVLRPARFDARSYLIRRAARILPLYYVSMVVALIVLDPKPLLTGAGRADVIAHVLLLHGLFRGMRFSIHGVWWTLSIEWLFYVAMVAFSPLLRRSRVGWLLGIGLVLVGVAWRVFAFPWLSATDLPYAVQQLPGTFDLFGAGMLLALAARSPALRHRLDGRWFRSGLMVASAVGVSGAMLWYHEGKAQYWSRAVMVVGWPVVLAMALTGLMASMLDPLLLVHRVARWSGLAYLGRVSYGIYLFHPFAIQALDRAWFVGHRDVWVPGFVVASILATLVLAVLFHHTVEQPAMAWARRATRSSRPVRPAADPAGVG